MSQARNQYRTAQQEPLAHPLNVGGKASELDVEVVVFEGRVQSEAAFRDGYSGGNVRDGYEVQIESIVDEACVWKMSALEIIGRMRELAYPGSEHRQSS